MDEEFKEIVHSTAYTYPAYIERLESRHSEEAKVYKFYRLSTPWHAGAKYHKDASRYAVNGILLLLRFRKIR